MSVRSVVGGRWGWLLLLLLLLCLLRELPRHVEGSSKLISQTDGIAY